MTEPLRRAQRDFAARARVVARRPLRYDAELSRLVGSPWVRAGSGLLRFGTRLLVVQDDALWLSSLDEMGVLSASPLAGQGQLLFDDKRRKPDFEAAALVDERVLLFGSGSLPTRERIASIDRDGRVELIEASELYAALRRDSRFAGSQLNIEGALVDGEQLLLCSRGNGAGGESFDATVEISADALLLYLSSPRQSPPPRLGRVEQYWLDAVDGVRLTLTDASLHDGKRYYLAAAEATPDAISDGPVLAVSIGLLTPQPRYALIESESGEPLRDKVEGLTAGALPGQWLAVVDADDASKPSDLLTLETEGL